MAKAKQQRDEKPAEPVPGEVGRVRGELSEREQLECELDLFERSKGWALPMAGRDGRRMWQAFELRANALRKQLGRN